MRVRSQRGIRRKSVEGYLRKRKRKVRKSWEESAGSQEESETDRRQKGVKLTHKGKVSSGVRG